MRATTESPVAQDNQRLVRRLKVMSGRTASGLILTALVVMIAVVGPWAAPHQADDFVGAPFSGPSAAAPLGTDYLGHDVLSVALHGGWTVLWMSLVATALGVLGGTLLGLVAGYVRPAIDTSIMSTMDVLLAFPMFVLPIIFVSMIGPQLWLLVVLVAAMHAPRVARLARATTMDIVTREYIEACELVGLPRSLILVREVLPNITTPLFVEFGVRMGWSVGIIAGLSFLGFGVQPPHADWGLMVNQNHGGAVLNPLALLVPCVLIACLTVGINLITESLARNFARTNGEG